MDTSLGFLSGSSIGYFVGYLFGGHQSGAQGLIDSMILSLGAWQLHIHHWLFSLALLLFLLFFIRKNFRLPALFFSFLFGFFLGLLAQGIIVYDDWHRILIKTN